MTNTNQATYIEHLGQSFSIQQMLNMVECIYLSLQIKTNYCWTVIWWTKKSDLGAYKKEAVEYRDYVISNGKNYELMWKGVDFTRLNNFNITDNNIRLFKGKIIYFFTEKNALNFMERFWQFFNLYFFKYLHTPELMRTLPKKYIPYFNYLQLLGEEFYKEIDKYCLKIN